MTSLILLRDFQNSQIEFWRKIQGFEGYDVSSFGRVRSWWTREGMRGGGGCRRVVAASSPEILRLTRHRQGYLEATLYLEGRPRKICKAHRLVAFAFLSNSTELSDVNHKSAVKHDNRLGNLEWKSKKGNVEHALENGLIRPYCGPHIPRVPDSVRRQISMEVAEGNPRTQVARKYGINRVTVGRIFKEKTKWHSQ